MESGEQVNQQVKVSLFFEREGGKQEEEEEEEEEEEKIPTVTFLLSPF